MRNDMTNRGPESLIPRLPVPMAPRTERGARDAHGWQTRGSDEDRPSVARHGGCRALGGRRPSVVLSSLMTMLARTLARCCAVLLLVSIGCGQSNGYYVDDRRAPPANDSIADFVPMSDAEERAIERIRRDVASAQEQLSSDDLSAEQRAELSAAIAEVRTALDRYSDARGNRSPDPDATTRIKEACVGIVALQWMAFAAMAALIVSRAPVVHDAMERMWHDVGRGLDRLARARQRASDNAEPLPAPPRTSDLPGGPPANDNLPPTLGGKPRVSTPLSPSPVPLPQPKTDDDRDRDTCKPLPWCPHLGWDPIHDMCADVVLRNRYPDCDVLVNGKRFDALDPGGVLWEVKTDDWSSYSVWLKAQTLKDHDKKTKDERDLANACGYSFKIAIADSQLAAELARRLGSSTVRHVPECRRQVKP